MRTLISWHIFSHSFVFFWIHPSKEQQNKTQQPASIPPRWSVKIIKIKLNFNSLFVQECMSECELNVNLSSNWPTQQHQHPFEQRNIVVKLRGILCLMTPIFGQKHTKFCCLPLFVVCKTLWSRCFCSISTGLKIALLCSCQGKLNNHRKQFN